MSSKKKYEHVSWDRGCYSFWKLKRCDIEHSPISSSSVNAAPSSSSSCAASKRPLNRSWRCSTLSEFLRASIISSMYCCPRHEARMRRAPLGQLGITNLQLHECQMDFPCALREVLCPVWKSNFENYISRKGMKGVFEGHLVARRSNEVTCP